MRLNIMDQPSPVSCGPTALHAVYRYFDDPISLEKVITEIKYLPRKRGTLLAFLGLHALSRNYKATLYTYNYHIFDPEWFVTKKQKLLKNNLKLFCDKRKDKKIKFYAKAYYDFISLGGIIRCQEFNLDFFNHFFKKGQPLIARVNLTYLYQLTREQYVKKKLFPHAILGEPIGHIVVLHGSHKKDQRVSLADPSKYYREKQKLFPKVASQQNSLLVPGEKLIKAILLNTNSYSGDILIIHPKNNRRNNKR